MVSFVGPPEKTRSGVVSFVAHRSTGTGDRDRAGDRVWVFRSDTMVNSGGEDEDWGEGSGDEEEREEGDDDLMEVEPSGSRDSVKPILR